MPLLRHVSHSPGLSVVGFLREGSREPWQGQCLEVSRGQETPWWSRRGLQES